MFLDFYHMREQPFGVTPDPRYLYLSRTHREALASLFYGIEAGRGFLALIAEPGMGKTTVLFQLLERLRKSACTAFLFQTQCNFREFLRCLLADMGIDSHGHDLVQMHAELNDALIRLKRADRRFVLVIDEAQNLEDSVLETVRLLSDFETPSAKLMQIVLAGQPQLAAKLARPSLAQLRQRIAILSRLEPLSPAETDRYIDHRLQVAGYEGGPLFSRKALALIGARSRGVPRNINNICFNALSLGFALQRNRIDARLVREVVDDLELEPLERESRDPVHSALTPDSVAPVIPGVARRSVGEAWRAFRFASLAVFMVLASLLIFTSIRSVLKIHPGRLSPPTAAAASGQSTPERPLETSKPSSLPTPARGQGLGRILSYTAQGKQAIFVDPRTQDAVIRNLEVDGEAVKNLSEGLKARHATVPWKRIAGMRDKMIHEYFGVNLQLVWDAIEQEVPRVRQKIEAILREWDVGRDAEGGTREAETRGAIAPVRPRRSLRQIHLRRPRGFNDRLIEQISAFNPELTNPNHILESLPSQYRDLSPAAVAAPRTAGASPTETIKAELTRLRRERAGLLTRYTARYPDVVKIDRQIEESEALLAASMKAVDPAKHGTVDAEQQRLLPLEVPGSPGTKAGHAANVLSITSSSQGIIHEQTFRVNATD